MLKYFAAIEVTELGVALPRRTTRRRAARTGLRAGGAMPY